MNPIHRKMTRDDFDNLPWQLGCKHEFHNGKAHVMPLKTALLTLRLAVQPRPERMTAHRVRPVEAKDGRGLVALYLLAFRTAPEYAGWSMIKFRERARQNVAAHLSESRQPWFCASRVIQERNRLLGGIFIEESRRGPIVQPLFVRPSHQRQGLATILMRHAEARLLQLGVRHLFSHCHLANEASLEWHSRYGFEELPSAGIARHRHEYFAHELQRRRRLQEGTEEELQALQEKRDYWHAEGMRLEAIGDEERQLPITTRVK